jgi:hypothetical protein
VAGSGSAEDPLRVVSVVWSLERRENLGSMEYLGQWRVGDRSIPRLNQLNPNWTFFFLFQKKNSHAHTVD